MKPPLHMLAGVGPSTRSSTKTNSAKEDAGSSLQESPDFLEDLPDNHYEEEEEDQSPKITRNHSQIISCDLPPDYEYDAMSSSHYRKRESSLSTSDSVKKAKLSDSVKSKQNSTRDSEIEILEETPGKTKEEKTKALLQLKKRAQSFIRASQVASTSQARLGE